MIAFLFIYSFIWGASYAVGNGALKTAFPNCKYRFIDRPLSLIVTAFWPILFFLFIVKKLLPSNAKDQTAGASDARQTP
jgi:hypothetical protein